MHRTGRRLDPRLRGLVRWVAASANRCEYTKAVARADLAHVGVSEAQLARLVAGKRGVTPAERAAMRFAHGMMVEPNAVADDDVRTLIAVLGEEPTVALVALLAYASFQDRLLLSLDVPVEPEGPPPPLVGSFKVPAPPSPAHAAPPRAKSRPRARRKEDGPTAEWLELQAGLALRKERVGRIRIPTREEVLLRIGDDHPAAWQADILWSRICYGFQPELTDAWFACVSAFRQECELDPVFMQCVFWFVARSVECFY